MEKIGIELNSLQQVYNQRAQYFRKKWKRALPFNEMLVNRWDKAKYLKFGKDTNIYDSSFVFGNVKVGRKTWIGPFTILDGTGSLKIGSYCSISTGVQIYTHDTVKWVLTSGKAKYEYGPVSIGNNCYIGPNVVIAKNVKIGNYCIIGANSFIKKSLPNNSIAYGMPVKVVGKVIVKNRRVELKYFDK